MKNFFIILLLMNINSDNVNLFIPASNFHPVMFQTLSANNLPQYKNITEVQEERSTKIGKQNWQNLESPGSYPTTAKNVYKQPFTNVNSMFKNIHGETLLNRLYFSEDNIKQIQNAIRFLVFKFTNQTIDEQSKTELLIVMRSIYLEYLNQPMNYSEDLDENTKRLVIKETQDEILRLNNIVVNEVVPKIVSELQQYLDYLRDASQPYSGDVMDVKPELTSIKGQRNYRSATSVYFGGDF
jgi:hypothetical protein